MKACCRFFLLSHKCWNSKKYTGQIEDWIARIDIFLKIYFSMLLILWIISKK